MAILVTGGAGFIGSHTCVELLNAGEEIVVMDNFYNSNSKALDGIRKITGKDFRFYEADMLDIAEVDRIFAENDIEQVIHFAGYKCVPESVKKPLMYYSNNLRGTFNILETMKKYGCTKFVFSSSATVYGIPATVPVKEDFPLSAINPYGSTKLIIENLCREMSAADPTWTMILLRYFNPVGAHESGLIGEDPNGIPNNLMPIVLDKATGKRDVLAVAGNDYPTPDGTCVRDYIHVVDLAKGHVAAVRKARTITGAPARAIPYWRYWIRSSALTGSTWATPSVREDLATPPLHIPTPPSQKRSSAGRPKRPWTKCAVTHGISDRFALPRTSDP